MTRRTLPICVAVLLLFTAQSQTTQEQQNGTEVEVLHAQLEIMESYNERLLATVYWSLGSIVTVGVLVAGFSWFANFRLYERDKETLRRELKGILDLEIKSISNDLRKDLDENVNQMLEAKLNAFRFDMVRIRIVQLKAEAESWKEQGVAANALRTYLEVVDEALKINDTYRMGETLDEIRRLLETKIEHTDARLAARFNTSLNNLPTEFDGEVEELKELLRTARK